jgi:hypothetical protein
MHILPVLTRLTIRLLRLWVGETSRCRATEICPIEEPVSTGCGNRCAAISNRSCFSTNRKKTCDGVLASRFNPKHEFYIEIDEAPPQKLIKDLDLMQCQVCR